MGNPALVVPPVGRPNWGNFHLATVVFRRALQLRGGARPRVDPEGHKALQVAYLEVTAGMVPWEDGHA